MEEFKDLKFESADGRPVQVTIQAQLVDGTTLLPDKEIIYDTDSINGYNDLYITVNEKVIAGAIIDKLINTARLEKPELVQWLEAKKLNYELIGRF